MASAHRAPWAAHAAGAGECYWADLFLGLLRNGVMAIEFLCPGGHRINAPDDRAGRVASCPRCGSRFRVPAISGGAAEALPPNPASGAARTSDSGELGLREDDHVEREAATEDLIAFLCPNGHRLTGPSRLQGKGGECPHCGAKFQIPLVAEESQQFTGIYSDHVADDSDALPMPEDTGGYSMRYSSGVPALCLLLRKLWDEKEHGAVIELHLDGGAMMVPDWFDEHHSCDSHGLFANQAADGTITMTAVAWDSIKRVIVRNVEGMPEGMFE